MSDDLDRQMQMEQLGQACAERRTGVVAGLIGDRDKLVAAAAYAQWISDHIRQETARCEAEIREVSARFGGNSDHLALLEREMAPFDGIRPSAEPPLLLGRLEIAADNLAAQHRSQLELAWRWASSAVLATQESKTALMDGICQHAASLCAWLASGIKN